MDLAIGEAEGVFRNVRRVNTTDASNFVIDKSDRFVEELLSNLSLITCVCRWSSDYYPGRCCRRPYEYHAGVCYGKDQRNRIG